MDADNEISLGLRIAGRVQGVGYRDWAVRTARSLGLSGWVRNRTDGSVEAIVSGPRGAVNDFADACRAGPAAARVDAVTRSVIDEAPSGRFEWRPTI